MKFEGFTKTASLTGEPGNQVLHVTGSGGKFIV